jgi:hypothetical protein
MLFYVLHYETNYAAEAQSIYPHFFFFFASVPSNSWSTM